MLHQIGNFSKLVGVSIETLRNWDKKKVLIPHTRSIGGTRYYSEEQVEQVKQRKG